jgi:REP element-mobilizing transposase RayT
MAMTKNRFDPQKHHHRSIRLPEYDYAQPGAYFVTIVAWQRECLFGEVVNEEMVLSEFGKVVAEKWQWLEIQYDYVELGAWVVMPNHFHGILIFHENRRGGSRSAPTPTKRKPLGGLVGAFKTVSTKHINLLRSTEGQIVWQRNYYEHIIRNEKDLQNKTDYINANPLLWEQDAENPLNIRE